MYDSDKKIINNNIAIQGFPIAYTFILPEKNIQGGAEPTDTFQI